MFIDMTSGLTRYQVQKIRRATPTTPLRLPVLQVLPVGMLVVGVSFWLAASHDWALAFAFALVVMSVLGVAKLTIAQHLTRLRNPAQPVLVVREGLSRYVAASELVVGDVIQTHVGQVLPVDAALATGVTVVPTRWLAALVWLTGRKPAAGCAMAGSRVQQAGQVTVLAIGAACAPQAAADAVAVGTAPTAVPGVAAALAAVAKLGHFLKGVPSLVTHVVRRLGRAEQAQLAALIRRYQATLSLVGETRHAAKEAAFRYNQDPVSWRLA